MPSRLPPQRTVGIRLTVDVPGLEHIREQFGKLGKNMSARYMASGLKQAAIQGGTLSALKSLSPRGKTGNLKRSVAVKTKRYIKTGIGLAIIGYKSGRKMNEPYDKTKLGYHQGLVEFGTKQRYRRTKDGRQVSTGKMPIGGSRGRPPVRTAWEMTRSSVESKMVATLTQALENAAKDIAAQVRAAQGPF